MKGPLYSTSECPLYAAPCQPFGTALILRKHAAAYRRCTLCGFVQAESPHWLGEAHSEAISSMDVGLMHRNLLNATITAAVISTMFRRSQHFIDYGGGH
jgi:hypothetical protein